MGFINITQVVLELALNKTLQIRYTLPESPSIVTTSLSVNVKRSGPGSNSGQSFSPLLLRAGSKGNC